MHRILLDDYRDIILRSGRAACDAPEVVMGTDGKYSLRYIPFEHVAREAKLVIVGITPGTTQIKDAYDAFRFRSVAGRSDEEALAAAKAKGAFAGAMRTRLIQMLEHFDIPGRLGVAAAADLWGSSAALLHSTSVIPHAAFEGSKMFNGEFDAVMSSPLLKGSFEKDFIASLPLLPNDAHFIALGTTPNAALSYCADRGIIRRDRILGMFPHPAGSSGSQVRYFCKAVAFDDLHPDDPTRNRASYLDPAYEEMSKAVSRLGRPVPLRETPVSPASRKAPPPFRETPARAAAPKLKTPPPSPVPAGNAAADGRTGIHSVVARGRDAGLVLYPHLYPDGFYVVSRSRFEEEYVRVGSLPEIAPKIAEGFSLRMSNPSEAPRRGPVLIAPGSIRGL